MSLITAVRSAGPDSVTAMAANQTLTGGAGIDTLTGYAGGGDTFADPAAGLNGDTINNWAVGDTLHLNNVVFANLHALTVTAGSLGFTDGTSNAAIKFAGTLAPTNFTATGADGHGGTLVGFHA